MKEDIQTHFLINFFFIVGIRHHTILVNIYFIFQFRYFKIHEITNIIYKLIFIYIHKYGEGYVNDICHSEAIAIIDIGERTHFNYSITAIIFSHELGHVMGFNHYQNFINGTYNKQSTNCSCQDKEEDYCLMYPYVKHKI
ncbi:hypothetical protein HZS_4109 [Henneguya salminicola]|nr:hypothetical protein HZS_4109 [Henneguya salminicola]